MDVSGLFGALTGSGNCKIDIILNANQNDPGIVPIDHHPSWKLHRNPFWRVKHPQAVSGGNKQQDQQPQNNMGGSLNNMMAAGSPGMNPMDPNSNLNGMNNPNMNNMNMNPNMNMNMNPNMNVHMNTPNMSMNPNNIMGNNMQIPNQFPQQQQQQMQMPGNPMSPQLMMNPPELVHEGLRQAVVAYEASRDVGGVVRLRVPPGKKVEHLGIKVQFIGRIDMGQGVHEGKPNYDFVSLSKELSPPGTLYDSFVEVPFLFKNMDKEHESYKGRNVAVRYFVKVVIERKFLPPITKEHDVWVQILGQEPNENEAIKMEVGIEDCLHIEFEYERRVFHLQDTIIGKIHFMLVRIKIKHMELAVIRRETSGEGVASTANNGSGSRGAPAGSAVDVNNICTETQTLVKYEIMDGAPVKGEVIPVKLCLRGIPCDLTPTYKGVNNRFSVRYFLNLVLVDAEDRRYFKQQEIILWRKELG